MVLNKYSERLTVATTSPNKLFIFNLNDQKDPLYQEIDLDEEPTALAAQSAHANIGVSFSASTKIYNEYTGKMSYEDTYTGSPVVYLDFNHPEDKLFIAQ